MFVVTTPPPQKDVLMRTRRFSSGLTLVELLVAITILLIATGSILLAVNFASKVSKHNLRKAVAINLVTQRLEQIKNAAYGNITAANFPNETNIQVGSDPIRYNRTVTIDTGTYKTVTVTVTWNQLGAPFVESESAVTIISPPP